MAEGGHICRRTGILFSTCTTRHWEEQSDQVLKQSDQWSWRRCDNKKCLQTDSWMALRTSESSQTGGKKGSSGQFPEELIISKGPSKGPSNLDSRYPSMPGLTGCQGSPLVPRPTGILSFNTCPENANILEYAYKGPVIIYQGGGCGGWAIFW